MSDADDIMVFSEILTKKKYKKILLIHYLIDKASKLFLKNAFTDQ